MWYYEKKLQYPINIRKGDLNMAKFVAAQLGGPDGELGASFAYVYVSALYDANQQDKGIIN